MSYLFIALQTPGSGSNVFIFVAIILVFFFFMVWPNIKKQKKEKKFQSNLKKGDKIVTISGMHGKILEIQDKTCIIETMAGKIQFNRSSISMEASEALNK